MSFLLLLGSESAAAPPSPIDYGPVAFINLTDRAGMSQLYNSELAVTSVNDPVGHIDDSSGFGRYVAQSVSASRPTLQQDANGFYCVRLDGIDDTLVGTLNLGGSKTGTVFVAYRMIGSAGAANGVYLAGASDTDTGAMELYQYNANGLHYSSVFGTAQLQGGVTVPAAVSIVTQEFDLSSGTVNADTLKVWVNETAQSPTYLGGPSGSVALTNGMEYSMTIGAMSFGNNKANADYYFFIAYDYILTAEQKAAVWSWINARCGAY